MPTRRNRQKRACLVSQPPTGLKQSFVVRPQSAEIAQPRETGVGNVRVPQLKRLKPLGNLWRLDLTSTKITDAGLMHLKALKGLRMFRVGGTAVSTPARMKLEERRRGSQAEREDEQ